MPFDSIQTDTVDMLLHEIDALATQQKTQRQLARFSQWKLHTNRSETNDMANVSVQPRYQLQKVSKDHPGDPGEGYFLSGLVLQGGGTLGLAHAGFIAGLEQARFRFPAVAGTSAGAIVAAGLFALRGEDITSPVASKLRALVGDVPMDQFVDGPRAVRRVLKKFAAQRSFTGPLYWPGLFAIMRLILRKRGLNPGHVFEAWMRDEVFAPEEIHSIEQLKDRMKLIAGDLSAAACTDGLISPFATKSNRHQDAYAQVLKLITTAMPTGMKFCLPQDIGLLSNEYGDISPARLVRMSMSIPFFFEPCTLKTHHQNWQKHVWNNFANFVADSKAWEMAELTELTFLDGGLFSNLPTDEVVRGLSAEIACISVPMVSADTKITIQRKNSLSAVVDDSLAVFNAVRLQHDRDAHQKLADAGMHNRKVIKIDTGRAHWLNFSMSTADKEELFLAGLCRARDILNRGDLDID